MTQLMILDKKPVLISPFYDKIEDSKLIHVASFNLPFQLKIRQ